MAFTTLDQVVAALPGQFKSVVKPSITAKAAGTFADLFFAAGNPGAASAPSAYGSGGTAYSVGTSYAGAINWANPGAGDAYLARMAFTGSVAGTLILYDRLWSSTGMSGTVTSAQTIASFPGLPTRAGGGDYVEPWLEWFTATGSTQVNATFAYTNSANVAGRSSAAFPIQTSPTAYQMMPIPLQAGDIGVRVPTSVTLSGTTGTAGAFGVTLLRRIAEIPIPVANVNTPLDLFALGLPKVDNDTCLSLMVLCSTTSTGVIAGNLSLVSG